MTLFEIGVLRGRGLAWQGASGVLSIEGLRGVVIGSGRSAGTARLFASVAADRGEMPTRVLPFMSVRVFNARG
jgi:hypothetical protein